MLKIVYNDLWGHSIAYWSLQFYKLKLAERKWGTHFSIGCSVRNSAHIIGPKFWNRCDYTICLCKTDIKSPRNSLGKFWALMVQHQRNYSPSLRRVLHDHIRQEGQASVFAGESPLLWRATSSKLHHRSLSAFEDLCPPSWRRVEVNIYKGQ